MNTCWLAEGFLSRTSVPIASHHLLLYDWVILGSCGYWWSPACILASVHILYYLSMLIALFLCGNLVRSKNCIAIPCTFFQTSLYGIFLIYHCWELLETYFSLVTSYSLNSLYMTNSFSVPFMCSFLMALLPLKC